MKIRNIVSTGTVVAGLSFSAEALAQITETFTFSPNLVIPDNNLVGVSSVGMVSSSILAISDLDVHLTISGGFNGDLLVYLSHDSGISYLLNRSGRTGANPFGYSDAGFNVDFSDGAANGDVHSYLNTLNPNGSSLPGIWEPDARAVSPLTVTDASLRTAFLSSFNGGNAAGDWTLFVADASPVGTAQLVNWSLTITGFVPESGTIGAGVVLSLLGGAIWSRRRHSR